MDAGATTADAEPLAVGGVQAGTAVGAAGVWVVCMVAPSGKVTNQIGLYQVGSSVCTRKVQDMNQVPDLIERALAVTKSTTALGKALGVPPQMVSMWKTGSKPCPPEDQASMAAIAGLDPVQTLVRAHLERHEGTAKGDRLMKVLGKSSLAIGAVIGSAGASAHQIFSTVEGFRTVGQSLRYFIQCIERLNGKRISIA